jgi:thiol-disulfide isomerase/thioredoxin
MPKDSIINLFYSNKCPYSIKLIEYINENDNCNGNGILKQNINYINIDNDNFYKIPIKYGIYHVPSILVDNESKYIGENAFKWVKYVINKFMLESKPSLEIQSESNLINNENELTNTVIEDNKDSYDNVFTTSLTSDKPLSLDNVNVLQSEDCSNKNNNSYNMEKYLKEYEQQRNKDAKIKPPNDPIHNISYPTK